ncbi:MAG: ABC transporter permease [Acidobacteria bacterium]|nr:MAG: ABC transporter permease [Acidobacteriota bacterium]
MSGVLQDLRYAFRQIQKAPAFAAVAVVTLALGIGANTAIFSVVNSVLLRALPFKDADRLVRIWHTPPRSSFPGMNQFAVSPANYLDWQDQNHVFDSMAIYGYRGFTLTTGGKAEQVAASAVSAKFFSTLGVQPIIGRVLLPDEDQPGRSNVVVLSHRFWQEHFGSNREIVGHNITVDGIAYLVAGVMPPSLRFPDFAQMWTPLAWTDQDRAVRGNHNYLVIARLRPGVDLKQAQAEMNTISGRLQQQYPADDKGWGAVVLPLHSDLVSDVRPALLVLLGAVGFILLIACVNVTNLSLARIFSRHKEIAIRTALGASSARIVRQILAESVVLALLGGALGLTYAQYGIRLIMAFLADKLPASVEASMNIKVLAFTAVVSVLTGVIAGILPALQLSRGNVNQELKQGLGRTDADSGGKRTRSILVVVEVALSLVLLIGAGLMIRSFQMLRQVNPGFESHGVLTMTAAVSSAKFPEPAQQISFFERVLERTRALPGVLSAGVIDDLPLSGNGSHQPIAVEGRPVVPMSEQPEVDVRVISAGYTSALRIPVLRGRDFDSSDVAGRPATTLVSASLAKEFWRNENPIGKHITLTFFPGVVREVIGVVGDVKGDGLDQSRPTATLYVPLTQLTTPASGGWRSFPMAIVVRSSSTPVSLVSPVTNAVREVDADVPVRDVLTMDDLVTNSLSQQRFNLSLLGAFAMLALILAAIGIYSVLSYSVRRRVQEIGIRLALGASLSDVLHMIVLEGMRPTLLGMSIGVVGALALARVMSSLVYGVKPTDPLTFLSVAAVLAIVALFASLIPAYRAAKVDPMVALRYE